MKIMNAIKIELSEAQWNVVLGALSELPYKVAVGVINDIVAQVREQKEGVEDVGK